MRKTEGTPCVRSRRQPARSPVLSPSAKTLGRERSGSRVAVAAPAGAGGRGGSALRAGGWGPGWGVVGQPVPGCVCNQHLSAHRQRRPRGAREPGRGQEQPEENNNRASRQRAARGCPGSPKLHLGESTWIPAWSRLPGRWGLGSRGRGGRYGEPALSGFMERLVCVGDREQQPRCSFIWRVGIWVFRPRRSVPSHPPPLTKCAASRESAVLVPE